MFFLIPSADSKESHGIAFGSFKLRHLMLLVVLIGGERSLARFVPLATNELQPISPGDNAGSLVKLHDAQRACWMITS